MPSAHKPEAQARGPLPRTVTICAPRPYLELARAVPLLLITCLGCGSGGVYPVEGNVAWKNGSPAKELAGTLVFFEQPDKQLSARGHFGSGEKRRGIHVRQLMLA